MVYKFSKDMNTCIFQILGQLCLVQIYSTYTYLTHTRLVSGWPLTWKSGKVKEVEKDLNSKEKSGNLRRNKEESPGKFRRFKWVVQA